MKLLNPRLNMPFIGMDEAGEPTREFATFKFKGLVDKRRLKRMVRRYVKSQLGRRIDTRTLEAVVHLRRVIVDHPELEVKTDGAAMMHDFANAVEAQQAEAEAQEAHAYAHS